MGANERSDYVKSIERAMEIMNQFTIDTPVLGVAELAKRTLMPKCTVYRILSTLEHGGFVKQDQPSGKYSLGLRLFQLGMVTQSQMDVRSVSLPFMREISETINETVNLNLVFDGKRVCVECVETVRSVRAIVQVGMIGPMTRGASGKVLLAHLPGADQNRIMADLPEKERQWLAAELKTVRQQGYAISHNERRAGASSVSAPIFAYPGIIQSGLTISGPCERFTPEVIAEAVRLVTTAAKEISQRLGYEG